VIESLAKGGMGVLLIAATPIGGDPSAWAQWGLAGLVVGYTLYRDWQREKRMSVALEKHQAWVQQTLLGALERSSLAMERISAVRSCPLAGRRHDD
jgi:hypothetical protein